MRVGILSIQHESNTFLQGVTTLQDFQNDAFLIGSQVRDQYAHSAHEIGGFFQGLAHEEIDAVPLFFARAIPSGIIDGRTAELLVQRLCDDVSAAGDIDGWLVAPHGAAVSEIDRDFDGYWLEKLRTLIDPKVPVICTLDAHANLSQRMVNTCQATIGYRTNPHIDQRDRGIEAARLIARTLRGEVRPTQAASLPKLAINIERQQTSSEPCAGLYRFANAQLEQSRVLSNSVFLGFPYADVVEMGTSFVVVTDDDPDLAAELANALQHEAFSRREEFEAHLIDVDTAVAQATETPGPVCLLDMGDNVGGGSPADSTILLHALHRRDVNSAFVCLFDPEAVAQARTAGAGKSVQSLAMGGKTDNRHGAPFVADVQVISEHSGSFVEDQVRHGGSTDFKMGPTVVVRTHTGMTIMLTSLRTPPFSLRQLTSCDLDPSTFQVIVAKGVQAPVAAYKDVCTRLIRVNTPGSTSADMTSFEYHHRHRPLFPFERESPSQIGRS